MEIKIKRLSESAVIPKYAKPGDAGMDLTATSVEYDYMEDVLVYRTGLAVEIPEGHVGLLFPRSSIYKTDLFLANSVGVIDSQYRGEIKIIFRTVPHYVEVLDRPDDLASGNLIVHHKYEDIIKGIKEYINIYAVGDRVAQLMIVPYPTIKFKEVDKLKNTERGDGGFGSSGN